MSNAQYSPIHIHSPFETKPALPANAPALKSAQAAINKAAKSLERAQSQLHNAADAQSKLSKTMETPSYLVPTRQSVYLSPLPSPPPLLYVPASPPAAGTLIAGSPTGGNITLNNAANVSIYQSPFTVSTPNISRSAIMYEPSPNARHSMALSLREDVPASEPPTTLLVSPTRPACALCNGWFCRPGWCRTYARGLPMCDCPVARCFCGCGNEAEKVFEGFICSMCGHIVKTGHKCWSTSWWNTLKRKVTRKPKHVHF